MKGLTIKCASVPTWQSGSGGKLLSSTYCRTLTVYVKDINGFVRVTLLSCRFHKLF